MPRSPRTYQGYKRDARAPSPPPATVSSDFLARWNPSTQSLILVGSRAAPSAILRTFASATREPTPQETRSDSESEDERRPFTPLLLPHQIKRESPEIDLEALAYRTPPRTPSPGPDPIEAFPTVVVKTVRRSTGIKKPLPSFFRNSSIPQTGRARRLGPRHSLLPSNL